MGWLSRFLGEMPEETKYKPTQTYYSRESENSTTLESYAEPKKSEDAAKLFLEAFRNQHDKDDELGSLEALEEKMKGINNLTETDRQNIKPVQKIGTLLGLGIMIISLGILSVLFFTENSGGTAIIFNIVILVVILSIALRKLKNLNQFT